MPFAGRGCRALCSRHHLPTRQGRGDLPNGARHSRRDPPTARATVMCMTAIHAQTKRKRLYRSVRRAEERLINPRMTPLSGLKHPQPDVRPGRSVVLTGRMTDRTASFGDFASKDMPLGECRPLSKDSSFKLKRIGRWSVEG